MRRHLAAALLLVLVAGHAHAQAETLKAKLNTLTGHMHQATDESLAAKSALDNGDTASACRHIGLQGGYLAQADKDLDTMQAELDANTALPDAARADWQSHILDARGSVSGLAASVRNTQSMYCA